MYETTTTHKKRVIFVRQFLQCLLRKCVSVEHVHRAQTKKNNDKWKDKHVQERKKTIEFAECTEIHRKRDNKCANECEMGFWIKFDLFADVIEQKKNYLRINTCRYVCTKIPGKQKRQKSEHKK